MKMLGIVAVGVVRESRKISGHPRIARIARSSLRQHSFLVCLLLVCVIHSMRIVCLLMWLSFKLL